MSHHPATSNKYGCGGCDRPDEADNLVQCDVCDAWWHFSCAGVTGSITDRSWMCTRCKRTSRASSRASVTSRSSSQLAESMARLRERQELQKRRTEVELEKKFLEEQRELLEASIAAEVERRSQVSRTDSRRRVQDWIESSADQTTSAAEGNRQPAASVVQQHDTHPRQGNSNAAAAADNLDIQLHSSPLRDRTIPAFEATGDFSDLQPLPEVISQHNAKDLIRELRVRLERCLMQSEPTSPQLADLQQQLQLCREEIEGMHSTVYRLTTVSMPAAQTDNIGTTVGSNDELVQPVAKPLGAIPKHRPNEFLQDPREVKLVKKECFNRWYGLFPYYLALTLSRLPVQIFLNVIFTMLVYWLAGLPAEFFRYALFTVVGLIVSLCAEGFGLMIGATFNVMNGSAIGPLTIAPFLGLAIYGFDFAPQIPAIMQWLMRASFIRGGVVSVVLVVFGYNRQRLDCNEMYCHFDDPKVLLHYVRIDNTTLQFELGILIAMTLFYRLLCYLSLRRRFYK